MTPRISTGALWIAAAVVAVGTGTMAVVAAATDSGDRLTQEEVNRQLAQARRDATTLPPPQGPTATESPAETPAGTPGGGVTTLSTTGGVIRASCDGDKPVLESWSPKPGYRVDEVVQDSAEGPYVWLESDSAPDVTIFVRCEDGTPVADPVLEDDDHGGRGDRDDDRDDDNSGPG